MTPVPFDRAAGPDGPGDCAHAGMAAAYQLATLTPGEMDAFREHLADGCVACAVELRDAREAVAAMDAAAAVDAMRAEAATGAGTTSGHRAHERSVGGVPGDALRERLLTRVGAGRSSVGGASAAAGVSDAPGAAADVRADGPSARIRSSEAARGPSDDARDDEQPWKRWAGPTGSHIAGGLATVRTAEGAWEPTAVEGVAVKRLAVDAERAMVTMLVKMDPGASYPAHRHGGAEECLVLDGDLQVAGETLHAGDYQQAEEGSVHGVQSTENGCLLFITSSQEDELLVGA